MAEIAIRTLLRPSEHLKAVLATVIDIPPSNDQWSNSDDAQEEDENVRILALVLHEDEDRVFEEGSLFICKLRLRRDGSSLEPEILHAFPITKDFMISAAQTKRKTIDLDAQPSSGHQHRLRLTINPGQSPDYDTGHEPIVLLTNINQELRTFLAECKKLITNDDGDPDISKNENRFQWLDPYAQKFGFLKAIGLVPQDLRLVNQPIHTRLSPAAAGSPGDDVADIQVIRDHFIRDRARNSALVGRRRLKIRLGTFNVNGELPSQDLSDWVRKKVSVSEMIPPIEGISPLSLGEVAQDPFQATDLASQSNISPILSTSAVKDLPSETVSAFKPATKETIQDDVQSDPDILVLAFQELDLSTEALIYSLGPAREDAWLLAIFAALGEKSAQYEKLASKQLVGMLIIILVKKTLASCFTDVRTSAAGAGIMGLMGNKGGTAIRVAFTPPTSDSADVTSPEPTILTFVNSHLAAFDEMFERRNSDFHDLSKRLNFNAEVTSPSPTVAVPPPLTAYESDVLFWMGDLNYRIDLPDGDIRSILSSENWKGRFDALSKYDQLNKAILDGKAFVNFSEHPITHFPTYRFSHGIATDGLGYDVKRKPAWTDRILYMKAHTINVQQRSYTSHPVITMSDHRPVSADFIVDVDVYDRGRRDAIARKIYRSMNDIETTFNRGAIKLDNVIVDMGKISYRPTSRTIGLRNTGTGPCAYRFVPVNLASDTCPDWLIIEPLQAILLPGELGHITFKASVSNRSAARLNLAAKNLNVTLILHTMLGKDHFIIISGEYQYTCFANKLSRLLLLPGPVRSLASPDDLRAEDRPINAPREIMRLVNWMMSEQGNVEGLFLSPADESIIDVIRECLDTGEDFPFSSSDVNTEIALAFAATLLRLLESLVDSVVPTALQAKCTGVTNRDEAFEILDAFPPASINVWVSITAFLHFICQAQSTNSSSEKALQIATVFAPILLRDEIDSSLPPISPLRKRDFLLFFIS